MRIVDRLIATSLPAVPRPLVRHFADRYMAGETLGDAVETVRSLNALGAAATVDVLGEFVHEAAQCEAMAAQYLDTLDAIEREGLDSSVSIKLSALGLEIDEALALRLAAQVVESAASRGVFVRIDMEHSGLTDQTLAIYRTFRERGLENVGIVLQAYLRRTFDDVHGLADLTPSVRLVKGIYIEPAEIAYTEPALVNRNFIALLREPVQVLEALHAVPVNRIACRQVLDQVTDTVGDLVGELRGGRAPEGVDVALGDGRHRPILGSPGSFTVHRTPSPVRLQIVATRLPMGLWAARTLDA